MVKGYFGFDPNIETYEEGITYRITDSSPRYAYTFYTQPPFIFNLYPQKNNYIYAIIETEEYNIEIEPHEALTIKILNFITEEELISLSTGVFNLNNTTYHYTKGHIHRDNDQPAIIHPNNTKIYYYKGHIHRDNDQPAIIHPDNTTEYYQHGQLHRDNDQPALISMHHQEYYQNGQLHRDNNLPAVVSATRKEWWKHGIPIAFQEC